MALADRDNIFDYLAAESLRAAVAIDDRFDSQVEILAQFPESGRIGRVEGTRELVVGRTLYIVAYRISGEIVELLRVLHGAQNWPTDFD